MKLTTALIIASSLASISDAKRRPSRFSVERIQDIKYKMERHYGKDLAGMKDPKTGKFDVSRLGWAKHGRRLGESITMTINSMSFDASTASAYWMGASKGLQWDGLKGESIQLSNCFAATYASIETVDLWAYDWETISSEAGKWKGFDVFLSDPIKILADQVVVYEMCDFGSILD